MSRKTGSTRVGIGGWTYEPWRGLFYPEGLQQRRELEYASRQVTAIEINGTFYGSQKPQSFIKWRDETPDGFVFSLKGPRYATYRKRLAEAGESVTRFVDSGVAELGAKLGPILWQLPPTHVFEADDLAAFLDLLPRKIGSRPLRHVIEARHESFRDPAFFAALRKVGMATVFADSPKYPAFDEITADFVYARMMRSEPARTSGYAPRELDRIADTARQWAASSGGKADVFVFFINGAKERAPAAARALLDRLA